MDNASGDSGLPALSRIDPLVHAPARLKLMTQLFVVEAADATFLVNQTGLTWGNLAAHLRKLEDCRYVKITKGFRGRKPHTMVALTSTGREAFRRYRDTMREALDALPDE
jgi:DNA-binding MarR family transcriptional regulator